MISVRNEINNPVIGQATILLMRHYNDEAFLDLVREVTHFNYTNDNGKIVADKIKNASIELIIRPYKTWNPYSKVIGYAKGNIIFVNTRKLNLPLLDRVNNFCHEATHLIGYSHDGNKANGFNALTVPYRVGAIFEKYISNKYLHVVD